MSTVLRIGTRDSQLAVWQANKVKFLLAENGYKSQLVYIKSEGDLDLQTPLYELGIQGIFTRSLDMALLNNRIDLAVHSMKDVPYELNDVFEISAIPVREDARDAFISMEGISFYELKKGAKIGTSSNRRSAQIKLLRPDIITVPIRGNVQTRIDKIEREGLDGIVLASAGLKRLNMENIITDYFDPHVFIPAVGQGALGVEVVTKGEHT